MAPHPPDFRQEHCLNTQRTGACETACMRCRDICPARAIELDSKCIPKLNEHRCTNCTACVHMCPSNAITHEEIDCISLIRQAHELVGQGKSKLCAACNAVSGTSTDVNVPCHAAWDPMLLACLAAEGVQTLYLSGINQCASCPISYGAEIMGQTEKDYAMLNKALGIHLEISWEKPSVPVTKDRGEVPEPERRSFFRNLFPAMAQSAIQAASQLHQTSREDINSTNSLSSALLPLRLRLFLRALPHLRANFTPVPNMSSLPLGAIQADTSCSACNACVEQCPTHALELRKFGTNRVLEFRPDACTGCQQCVSICPEHAIEVLPAISLPPLLTRRARPLVMVQDRKNDNVPIRKNI